MVKWISDENARLWLQAIDNSDREFLLQQLAKSDLNSVLEFLLRKANEWSDITMGSLSQCGTLIKRQIFTRLLNQLTPFNFDRGAREDDIIIGLILK